MAAVSVSWMERSFQKLPGDTRAAVIAAAADLFAKGGYAGTSISAIRNASGVLPSSIYWEFGSKEGILAAVLEDSASRWLDQTRESSRCALADQPERGPARLAAYFYHLARAFSERPEFLRLLLLLALERREVDPSSLDAIRAVRTRALGGMFRLFREFELVDASVPDEFVTEIARLTMAFFDGAVVAKQIDADSVDLGRMFALFQAGLVSALAAGDGALFMEGAQRWELERANNSSGG